MAYVPQSLQPILRNGAPVYGARLFAFEAGTTTPRAVFRTSKLEATRQHERPVPAGADGTFPVMFVGEGDYDLVIRDGETGPALKTILGLPGDPKPSIVDDTAFDPLRQIPTGALVPMTTVGRRNGFVRPNGLRIGSAASDADERAADDTLALFTLYWNAGFAIVGGRGASAEADFAAGKTIALPNFQNRTFVFTTNMGNPSEAASLAGGTVNGGSVSVGTTGGAASQALSVGQLPAHKHTASFKGDPVDGHDHSVAVSGPGNHNHGIVVPNTTNFTAGSGTTNTGIWQGLRDPNGETGGAGAFTPTVTEQLAGGHTPAGSVTLSDTGGGQSHNNLQPFCGASLYIKL